MDYQFDVSLTVPMRISALDQERAEEKADSLIESLLVGSALAQEYPDGNYTFEGMQSSSYLFAAIYTWKALVAGNSIANARENLPITVQSLVKGSPLALLPMTIGQKLSDEQPGLDARLDEIDEDLPFAIAADASLYHIACAKVAYGEEAVQLAIDLSEQYSEERIISTTRLYERYPKDTEGNLLHVILGRDHIQEVRNAWANEEEIYASCECLNLLYDDPREEKES